MNPAFKTFIIFLIFINFCTTLCAKKDDTPKLKEVNVYCYEPKGRYKVIGTVQNNLFVNDTEITILTNSGDTVISGLYHYDENDFPTIQGCLKLTNWREPYTPFGSRVKIGTAFIQGKFKIQTQSKPRPLSAKKTFWDNFELNNIETESSGFKYGPYIDSRHKSIICTNDTISIENTELHADIKLLSGVISEENTKYSISEVKDFSSYNNETYKIRIYTEPSLKDVEIVYKNGVILKCSNSFMDGSHRVVNGNGEVIWPDGNYVSFKIKENARIPNDPTLSWIYDNAQNEDIKCVANDGKIIEGIEWLEKPDWVLNSTKQREKWDKDCNSIKGSWTETYQAIQKIYDEHNEELAEERRKEQEREAKERERYNRIVNKYGSRYAKAIIDRRLELGMTKQMVNEFLPDKFYIITRNGNTEYWRYSEEKAQKALISEGKRGVEALMIVRLLGGSIKSTSTLSGLIGGPSFPDRITFTNGKVTSITD